MRYYDTAIKVIEIVYISGIGQWKTENHRAIEISKETPNFIYGTAWDGRYKFDKKQNQWFRYEHYVWREISVKG